MDITKIKKELDKEARGVKHSAQKIVRKITWQDGNEKRTEREERSVGKVRMDIQELLKNSRLEIMKMEAYTIDELKTIVKQRKLEDEKSLEIRIRKLDKERRERLRNIRIEKQWSSRVFEQAIVQAEETEKEIKKEAEKLWEAILKKINVEEKETKELLSRLKKLRVGAQEGILNIMKEREKNREEFTKEEMTELLKGVEKKEQPKEQNEQASNENEKERQNRRAISRQLEEDEESQEENEEEEDESAGGEPIEESEGEESEGEEEEEEDLDEKKRRSEWQRKAERLRMKLQDRGNLTEEQQETLKNEIEEIHAETEKIRSTMFYGEQQEETKELEETLKEDGIETDEIRISLWEKVKDLEEKVRKINENKVEGGRIWKLFDKSQRDEMILFDKEIREEYPEEDEYFISKKDLKRREELEKVINIEVVKAERIEELLNGKQAKVMSDFDAEDMSEEGDKRKKRTTKLNELHEAITEELEETDHIRNLDDELRDELKEFQAEMTKSKVKPGDIRTRLFKRAKEWEKELIRKEEEEAEIQRRLDNLGEKQQKEWDDMKKERLIPDDDFEGQLLLLEGLEKDCIKEKEEKARKEEKNKRILEECHKLREECLKPLPDDAFLEKITNDFKKLQADWENFGQGDGPDSFKVLREQARNLQGGSGDYQWGDDWEERKALAQAGYYSEDSGEDIDEAEMNALEQANKEVIDRMKAVSAKDAKKSILQAVVTARRQEKGLKNDDQEKRKVEEEKRKVEEELKKKEAENNKLQEELKKQRKDNERLQRMLDEARRAPGNPPPPAAGGGGA